MTDFSRPLLDAKQLTALEASLHRGAAEASKALAQWTGRQAVIEIDSLENLPLEEATSLLAVGDQPLCFCIAQIQGRLTGTMVMAFDDASGLALAGILLEQQQVIDEWTELATSAALETTNILCCAYLNSLSKTFSQDGAGLSLLPSPPYFQRDFAECLLQFVLMQQAIASDQILLAKTTFTMDRAPVNWTLLLVPDTESMLLLRELLATQPGDVEGT